MAAIGASTVGEEERFHGLPPLKRFKMLEKERVQHKIESETSDNTSQKSGASEGVKVLCCLPAKKRVCALQFFAHDEEEEQENKTSPLLAQKRSPALLVQPLQPILLNCELRSENTSAVAIAKKKSKKNVETSAVVQDRVKVKLAAEQMQKWHLPVVAEKIPARSKLDSRKKDAISAAGSALHAPGSTQVSVHSSILSTGELQNLEPKPAKKKGNSSTATPNFAFCNPKISGMDASPALSNLEMSPRGCADSVLSAKEELDNTQQHKKTETSSVSESHPIHDQQNAKHIKKGSVNFTGEEKCADFEQKEESDDDDDDDGVFCDVCKEADAEPSDPIVFCDGCNVMVHASCYGSPLIDGIPDGDWFCRQCESENRRKKGDAGSKRGHSSYHVGHRFCMSRVCCLCPNRKGAMKQTTDGAWAHLSCALYVPEVFYKKAQNREEIECGSVPAWRWELPCAVCSTRGQGSCIQCTEVGCSSTFHVSCALDAGLSIDYRNANVLTKTPAIVIAFCPSHSRQALTRTERRRFKIVPRT
ncbi:hypothetical protein L7F22_013183 [Adiantum nelumboides]|nr:hypothetical protein [Adiantum nelumboides]